MTKEEAIKKLNVIKRYLTAGNPIWDVREVDEVLDIAIKALEELPKRREEAKRWKRKALKVEPVKHGEWKYCFYKDINNTYVGVCECTVCKQREYSKHKYCPNCGAKMDKE